MDFYILLKLLNGVVSKQSLTKKIRKHLFLDPLIFWNKRVFINRAPA